MHKLSSGFKTILILGMLLFSVSVRAQYGWNFQYAPNNVTTHWRHLASGDTVAIASFTFSRDIPTDPQTYYLKGFRLWPITNSSAGWFIDELQLYLDKGNRVFSADDSLISGGLEINIPDQADSVNSISFNFNGDSLLLVDNRMLIVVAVVHNWHDDNPENPEIDTTAAGPYGKWFSIKVFKEDITVSPIVPNDINTPTPVQFDYQAYNLPVTVRNAFASIAEDDSSNLNMFYPNYRALNGSAASKAQRIDDLSFYADIFLPARNDSIELSLKSVSLQFGFDNRILEFVSAEYGNVWGDDSWFYVDTSLSKSDLFDPDHPEYTIYQYDAQFNGSETVNSKYELVDSSSIVRLKFRVIGPGVSPIFIQNPDCRDRWGVRYHNYQHLQNYASYESDATSERYDAWAKYVLGDFTVAGGDEISTAGICDGRVTWEDIALFSDYIWLNPGNSSWTKRFDIGSSESVSPSQYCHDDTTNFYDLMVLGSNYRRSYKGVFNQKPLSADQGSVKIEPVINETADKLNILINVKNASDLKAAHIQLKFDPREYRYQSVHSGKWVEYSVDDELLLIPNSLADRGEIDINFIVLDGSLNGEGDLLEINLDILQSDHSVPEIISVDFRDGDCRNLLAAVNPPSGETLTRKYVFVTNFPNPFNAETQISWNIPENQGGTYTLMLFDVRGNRVATFVDQYLPGGKYNLKWDGTDQSGNPVASGLYFLTLNGNDVSVTRKIMLLR